MGIFGFHKKKDSIRVVSNKNGIKELNEQIAKLDAEHDQTINSTDLTPEAVSGKKRKYHYKDVAIWVVWQYGGQYGKSCESIGMRRGDVVELLPLPENDDDPESISVYWKGTHIGFMKSNRMRTMVHQWKDAGLPVIAIVSHVGGETKILLEFAFYGYIPKTK